MTASNIAQAKDQTPIMKSVSLISLFAMLLSAAVQGAEFAPMFTNGTVLQREQPLVIWGTGREGDSVTVELLAQAATDVVKNGRWRVSLPPQVATTSATLQLRADTVVDVVDVAIGEVWLCLGQSNMEWRLNQCGEYSAKDLANPDNPSIRLVKIPHRPYTGDQMPAFGWKKFDRSAAGFFPAVP